MKRVVHQESCVISAPNVCALIVTYGDRVDYLRRVVNACMNEGVASLLIVDNASHRKTRDYLDDVSSRYSKLKIIHSPTNEGSAGGFALGLLHVMRDTAFDLVWLLDDDNMPSEGSLRKMLLAREIVSSDFHPDPILFAFRKYFDSESALTSRYGSIRRADAHFWTVLCNRIRILKGGEGVNYLLLRTYVGPYGGMLISRSAIGVIGTPDRSYYLYGDDFEFSTRAVMKGYEMFTVVPAVVVDLDRIEKEPSGYLATVSDDMRMYYTTRNHLYLRRAISTNQPLYWIDVTAFLSFMFVKVLSTNLSTPVKVIRSIRAIFRGIRDSHSGKMGKLDLGNSSTSK